MVANRQERGCGRQHRARSRVDRISGRTNGRGNVLRVDQTLPSYQCRTAVVLISYWQSWTDKDRELRPRSDGFATIMTDRGGLLWSGTSAKNDRHSVTWALLKGYFNRLYCWKTIRWRHNGHDSFSNHQPHDCLLNRLFGRRWKKTSKLAFVWGIHRGPVNSPQKWPVTRKMFPFDDVIMKCAHCPRFVVYCSGWVTTHRPEEHYHLVR